VPENKVALAAQKATNGAGLVVVVNHEAPTWSARRGGLAYCAECVLLCHQIAILLKRDSIPTLEIGAAAIEYKSLSIR
jgi:hypothetical protein